MPARRAEDPGSNPGPGDNCSLKLVKYKFPDGWSEIQIFVNGNGFRKENFHTVTLQQRNNTIVSNFKYYTLIQEDNVHTQEYTHMHTHIHTTNIHTQIYPKPSLTHHT